MRLVPRQLHRAGMTGVIPYYGGRLTPAHAYAVTHPQRPAPPSATASPPSAPDVLTELQHLLDTGVLTQSEYDEFRKRVDARR